MGSPSSSGQGVDGAADLAVRTRRRRRRCCSMRLSPANAGGDDAARKWSPSPVRSATSARGAGDRGLDALLELVGGGHPEARVATATLREALSTAGHLQAPRAITFTDKGAEKVQEFLASQSADVATAGLRVGVRGGGCSGFQYQLAFDEQRDGDVVFEDHGLRLLVDSPSLPYVDGSIDRLRRLAAGRRLPGRQPERRRGLRLRLLLPRRGGRRGLRGLVRARDRGGSRWPPPSPWGPAAVTTTRRRRPRRRRRRRCRPSRAAGATSRRAAASPSG